jgi:hypothetical protein
MKNYLQNYSRVTKHQEGGPMGGAPEGAPQGAPQGDGSGVQEMLMQVLETQDPNMALQFCNMLAEQMGLAGGGGAPQGGAAPMGRSGMMIKTPTFKKGGRLA